MNGHLITVFISHSWAYNGHHEKLSEWIFDTPWNFHGVPLRFVDHSVPKDDPIHSQNAVHLKNAIFARIQFSDVIVIPTGMYANWSHWIQKEIDGAQGYRKPILAVNSLAQRRTTSVVSAAASDTVGWDKESVVSGIWKLSPRR